MSFDKKFFHWSLVAYLAISSYFYWQLPPGFNGDLNMYANGLQELFFRYGAVWLWGCSIFMKRERTASIKDMGVFLLYVLIVSSVISFDMRARSQIMNIFIGMVFYKTVIEYFDFSFLRNIGKTFFGILLVNLVFCVAQHFNVDPLNKDISGIIVGFPQKVGLMRLSEHLGTLCAILGPLTTLVSPWLGLITLPLLYYADNSTALVCLVTAFSFLIYRRYGLRWFVWFLVLTLSVGAWYVICHDMPGGSFGYRLTVWQMGIQKVLRSSLYLGLGIGSWFTWGPQTKQMTTDEPLIWLWAHNEYLQVLFELGLAGFILLIIYLKNRVLDFKKAVSSLELDCLFATFVSLALVSILHFPFHLGRFSVLAVFVLACYHAKIAEVSK